MSKNCELSSYSGILVAFSARLCTFVIFGFRLTWDEMSKYSKWTNYRLIRAILWYLGLIIRVFFDFRVSTHLKYNVKMSKIDDFRLIWAISWHFGIIMCVFLIFRVLSHLRSNVKMSKMGTSSSYLSNFVVSRRDIARFVGYPAKVWQKI